LDVPTAHRIERVEDVESVLGRLADPERKGLLQRFFKTGAGQYGEGDRFQGITVPQIRAVARRCADLPRSQIIRILRSPIHEQRLLALLLMVRQVERGEEADRKAIYRLYLANTSFINNWDLVDVSAPHIVGGWLAERSRAPLRKLARSKSVWERRIAVMATLRFIQQGESADALDICRLLLEDRHDLIHKATGWMLREVGKRASLAAEEGFLREHCRTMPRTMLRYAIERFPEDKRRRYLRGAV
jgi:3-methyladenine DNA glycosylase AlkD